MKHVVNFSEVAHLWANRKQSDARNSQNNFYFDGEVIYSYGGHFPIARLYNKNGEDYVFMTLQRYSNTTSKHIWEVERAASHKNKIYMKNPLIYTVDKKNFRHNENIEYWIKNIQSNLDYLGRARKKENVFSAIESERKALNTYLNFFGLKLTAAQKKIVNAIDNPNIIQERKLIAEKEKERIKKEKIAHAKRVAVAAKHFERNLVAWHDNVAPKDYPHDVTSEMREYDRSLGKTYIRVSGDEIETSKGVKVPIDVAKRYYNFYLRVIKNGGCDGNCNYKMLDYDVSLANAERLIVGCHNIERSEIDAIAVKLGWN